MLLYLRETHLITDWRAVNETQLRDFAVYAATRHRTLKGKPISASTLRQWLSIIRSFFSWLNRTGHLLHNPAERLAFPHKEQSLPHVLNESDIVRLIETPDTATTLGLRDRALLERLYATGIRHSEAHKLDLYDVDTAAHQLTIRLGKGQRDRVVPLTETAACPRRTLCLVLIRNPLEVLDSQRIIGIESLDLEESRRMFELLHQVEWQPIS